MSTMIKQEDGTEKEYFSAEELAEQANAKAKEIADTQIAEERERLESERDATILEKENEFAVEREELEKLRKKDLNFESLRKSKTLTPEQEEAAKRNADEMAALKAKVDLIEKQPLEAAKANFVATNFAADDTEGRELFDFYYKKISVGAKTMEDVNKAVVAAFAASTQGQRQPNTSGSMARTSVSDTFGADNAGHESEASREFGSLLGVSPDAKKQFGDVLKTGSVKLFSQNPPKSN